MIKDLITNKDLKPLKNKADKGGILSPREAVLLGECQFLEAKIQAACYNIIKSRYFYLRDCSVKFAQVDNGDLSGTGQKKKAATGTQKGFKDVIIFLHRKTPKEIFKKQIFVEFKRISSFKISPEQQQWHNFHKQWGDSTHFCNNTVYFGEVICKEIDNFLLIKT